MISNLDTSSAGKSVKAKNSLHSPAGAGQPKPSIDVEALFAAAKPHLERLLNADGRYAEISICFEAHRYTHDASLKNEPDTVRARAKAYTHTGGWREAATFEQAVLAAALPLESVDREKLARANALIAEAEKLRKEATATTEAK